MKTAWIDAGSYISIIEQAARNDGKAIIHSRGARPLQILIDPEYAKKELAEYELMLARFERRNGLIRESE